MTTSHSIGKASGLSLPPRDEAPVLARGGLRELLRANTVIGVFEDARKAERVIERIEEQALAVRLWKLQGPASARALREAWRRRPVWRRLLSYRDEDRLVDDLVRYLDRGETVVALRGRAAGALSALLVDASHVVHIGAWAFRFVR